jgi:hypothetical protein
MDIQAILLSIRQVRTESALHGWIIFSLKQKQGGRRNGTEQRELAVVLLVGRGARPSGMHRASYLQAGAGRSQLQVTGSSSARCKLRRVACSLCYALQPTTAVSAWVRSRLILSV